MFSEGKSKRVERAPARNEWLGRTRRGYRAAVSAYKLISMLVAIMFLVPATAQAQGVQNWLTNESNKIQQFSNNGLINSGQSSKLQNRNAQIQAQEQQYLNQNGGFLTPQQQQQIGSELRGVNKRLHNDIRQDNPNLTRAPGTGPWTGYGSPVDPGMTNPYGGQVNAWGQPAYGYGQPVTYGQSPWVPGQPVTYGQPPVSGQSVDAYGQPVNAYGQPVNAYGQPFSRRHHHHEYVQ